MTQTTPTCLWNDSASRAELSYSIENGGVGATCNPVIVVDILKSEWNEWQPRICELISASPTATEDEISWKLVEEISILAARCFGPSLKRIKAETDDSRFKPIPVCTATRKRVLDQAVHFSNLAPNLIVKIPATKAGIAAMEDATYRGVSVNATVCFTLPQCIAVAEAIERGLKRRKKEGQGNINDGAGLYHHGRSSG